MQRAADVEALAPPSPPSLSAPFFRPLPTPFRTLQTPPRDCSLTARVAGGAGEGGSLRSGAGGQDAERQRRRALRAALEALDRREALALGEVEGRAMASRDAAARRSAELWGELLHVKRQVAAAAEARGGVRAHAPPPLTPAGEAVTHKDAQARAPRGPATENVACAATGGRACVARACGRGGAAAALVAHLGRGEVVVSSLY
jgi:hypothetical protein